MSLLIEDIREMREHDRRNDVQYSRQSYVDAVDFLLEEVDRMHNAQGVAASEWVKTHNALMNAGVPIINPLRARIQWLIEDRAYWMSQAKVMNAYYNEAKGDPPDHCWDAMLSSPDRPQAPPA